MLQKNSLLFNFQVSEDFGARRVRHGVVCVLCDFFIIFLSCFRLFIHVLLSILLSITAAREGRWLPKKNTQKYTIDTFYHYMSFGFRHTFSSQTTNNTKLLKLTLFSVSKTPLVTYFFVSTLDDSLKNARFCTIFVCFHLFILKLTNIFSLHFVYFADGAIDFITKIIFFRIESKAT